jgi:hypothetical protein
MFVCYVYMVLLYIMSVYVLLVYIMYVYMPTCFDVFFCVVCLSGTAC